MSSERKFSFIYSEIIEDENDMIGHIAYSLYKSNKISYIEQFKADNNNQQPSETDLNGFHQASRPTIPALRIQAEQLLANFTQLTLEETILEIQLETKENQENTLREIIKPIIPGKPKGPWDGFWMSVLVKGVQALVVAIIFFLIIFSASAKDDFWGTIRKMIPESHKIQDNKQSDTTKTETTTTNH
ncbi:hypothetical protein V3Q90_05815 [Flavobacterium oreochromis]|uniref:Uncharacterized protein n=1 Tax=Flavobacterium oreochromis TaxID=2906078 RepID=A0ABW8P6P9_9FLAO|nr:hypothetical protein [Flavobacterium oreochromis]OWP77871.1 hypothetical protein BWG23_03595 [Flavobacterium oreochromis]